MKRKLIFIAAICLGLVITIVHLLRPDTSKPSQEIILTAQHLASDRVAPPEFIVRLEPAPNTKVIEGDSICVGLEIGYLLSPNQKLGDLPKFLAEHTQVFLNGYKVIDGVNTVISFPPVFGGKLSNGEQSGYMEFCAYGVWFAKGMNLAEIYIENMSHKTYYYAWTFTTP